MRFPRSLPRSTPRIILILICSGLLAVVSAVDALLPLGIAFGMLHVLPIILAARSRSPRVILAVAAAATILIPLDMVWSPPSVSPLWVAGTNRGLSILMVWLVAGLQLRAHRLMLTHEATLQREAVRAEMRVLSGLLPICASCKKIRGEGGGWQQLESYILGQSEATFTHGLCDECGERLLSQVG